MIEKLIKKISMQAMQDHATNFLAGPLEYYNTISPRGQRVPRDDRTPQDTPHRAVGGTVADIYVSVYIYI